MAPRRKLTMLTIGAATRDIFVQSEGFIRMADRNAPDGFDTCIPAGAKITAETVIYETGGGATNAAVTFARFGIGTACAVRVGKDADGDAIRNALAKERIDISGIQIDREHRTAASIILLAGTGQRAILVHRGASEHLAVSAIPWARLSPEWIYLTSLGKDVRGLKQVFAEARRRKTRIAWNPGAHEIALGLHTLTPFLGATDILLLNREEAAELADVPPRHLEAIIHKLGPLPKSALCITDGASGAYVHAKQTTLFAPALHGKRVNTTGAGDAFGSGFVAGCIRSGAIETGLRAGMLNALGVITHMGAKAGILPRFPTQAALKSVRVQPIRL